MSQLTLAFQYDQSADDRKKSKDDFGRITLSAKSDHFSGEASFWAQWRDVKEFGEALAQFPITTPIVAQWGYEMQEGKDLLLKIEVHPPMPGVAF